MPKRKGASLPELLKSRGVHPSRRLGQNFMMDRNMLDFLVRQAALDGTEIVLEVGSGVGFLTERIAAAAARVVSVEIDSRLYEITTERLASADNVTLLNCDALDKGAWHADVTEALARFQDALPESSLKLVANLPYSAATAVVQAVLMGGRVFSGCVFTVQWEVAERIAAEPGDKQYGYISALTALLADVRIIRKLPATVFWPRPKIESAIVELIPSDEKRRLSGDVKRLTKGLSMLFGSRRKQILGLLNKLDIDEGDILKVENLLERRGVSARERVFRLTPEVLREIFAIITV